MKKFFYLFLAVSLFVSCGQSDTQKEEEAETEQEPAGEMKYTLTPFTQSAEFPDAAMNSMNYKEGKFSFEVGGDTYKLGEQTSDAAQKMCANSAKGQHIHVIVDDNPYAARYTAEFDDLDVADGEHYILAFLSRSYHESIKTEAAHKAVKVAVGNKSIGTSEPITETMLFYSRPKGTYVGKANTDKVMLDFYLVNGILGGKYKVKADINGEEHMIDKWQPYYIEGLPMGKNKITLTLLDEEGNAVATPLNPVTREFELKADELTDQ